MFSFFSAPSATSTRFEQSEILKQIRLNLSLIQDKGEELKNSANTNGPGSIDFNKYSILDEVLSKIEEKITSFNLQKARQNKLHELEDELALIKQMVKVIEDITLNHKTVLNTPRNNHKQNLSVSIGYGATAAGGAFAVASSWSVIGVGISAWASAFVACTLTQVVGLEDHNCKCKILLDQLEENLTSAKKNLDDHIVRNKRIEYLRNVRISKFWGAVALNASNPFSKLPLDIKSLIYSDILRENSQASSTEITECSKRILLRTQQISARK